MEIAKYIDHTLLRADATVEDIRQLCEEAGEYGFAAVCVNPCYVQLAAHLLRGTGVKTATVIGFPLGANLTIVKACEAAQAVGQRADELDMVVNIGAVKTGAWDAVREDVAAVVRVAEGAIVKVILETACLTPEEKRRAAEAAVAAGAHYVKTSTGFGVGGATVEDVALLRSIVGEQVGVKASGGIRDRETALRMIQTGANRIGTSAGVAICKTT